MSSDRLRGSCACGGVRVEIVGRPLWLSVCHCSRCRKVGGSATVAVRAEQFHWLAGEDLVQRYRPEPPFHIERCFCRVCGSYIGEPRDDADGFPIAAHLLDDDPGLRAALHEHVADKPDWDVIGDDAPRFPGHPPGFGPAAD